MPDINATFSSLEKLTLHGFNNLTKNLAISVYKIYHTSKALNQSKHLQAINTQFNPQMLSAMLNNVCQLIGANVLNVSQQAYQPQGASVTMMIAEGDLNYDSLLESHQTPTSSAPNLVAHLDKSHLCVHSYPESHPSNGISTIRIDFELSTCGIISPLHAANYLIECLNADLISLDYRVRGFTRGVLGEKYHIDHEITSIQHYLSQENQSRYSAFDMNSPAANIFFTQLKSNIINIEQHVLSEELSSLSTQQKELIINKITKEIDEIFLPQRSSS